ncbi:MAG: phosphoenolpyruvate--protein phosphotransferase [Lachnospiraceae bacterium]|nr:phosphoenolpyruvate--protein phosphotransferase [Lachnospiraceae bacterium]
MQVLKGKTVCGGIATGYIRIYEKENAIEKRIICDIDNEILRFHKAKETAFIQLTEVARQTECEYGNIQAEIFEAQKMLLTDEAFLDAILEVITGQKVNAEYAVSVICEQFYDSFSKLEEEYFRARAIDIKDISDRLLSILCNTEIKMLSAASAIIMAYQLTPSQVMGFAEKKPAGIVTENDSVHSHTAIVAKTMNIPMITGIKIKKEWNGKQVVVDTESGNVLIEPDKQTITKYQNNMQCEQEKRKQLEKYRGVETINKYGKKINLYANIGDTSDVESAIRNDAEGIGLLRSEFLYLQAKDYPKEETLFFHYKKVVESMKQKRVVIRTIDIGADKQADYFELEQETNPAMGYRAIRICLTKEEVFKTQLRAILRASVYGNVDVMFPMITSVWEIRKIKEILRNVKKELDVEKVAYGHVKIGIMIETPAAVIISDLLAGEVDFFSIGTNDLTQYTLAVDRQNPKLDAFYDSRHEAVLRMIHMTVENAHKAGITVGICGELASDLTLTDTFMEFGIDDLSVLPTEILKVREKITK